VEWDIRFNPQKSKLACFGGNRPDVNCVTLGAITLCWSSQIKYLGCNFRCKECEIDPSCFIGRFYGTFNNILNAMGRKRQEITALHLIQTYCLPSLTYGCKIWSMKSHDVKRVDVAWNNAFRKIINSHWYESVKPLQFYCGCFPVSIILPMRKLLLWRKMPCSENVVFCLLAKYCKDSIFALVAKYHFSTHDVFTSSVTCVKQRFWDYFPDLL